MSKGDHIVLDAGISDKKMKLNYKGSRNAEKYYMDNNQKEFSKFYDFHMKENNLTKDPVKFYDMARDEWEKQKKKLRKFRTKENLYVNDDFRDYITQLNAVKMQHAISDYRLKTSYSDKKFAPPADFEQELNNALKNPVNLLLSNPDYNTWKIKQLLPKGTFQEDSLVLAKISELENGVEKDRLLRTQLRNTFALTKEESERDAIAARYLGHFSDGKFRKDVEKQLFQIKSQQKGAQFPPIIFEDEQGKSFNIANYKGKYVIIDFWATWCAPCKETSPLFDYQAKEYSYYENLVFVAASIDKEKNKWKMDLKNKDFNVTNLWVKNQDILSAFGVTSIPRFMVIDPEGKIYNANMPRPGDSNFTDILDKIAENKVRRISF